MANGENWNKFVPFLGKTLFHFFLRRFLRRVILLSTVLKTQSVHCIAVKMLSMKRYFTSYGIVL